MFRTVVVLMLLAGLAEAAESTAQKFKLITNPLVLRPGKDAQTFTVALTATGLPVDAKKPPTPALEDSGTPAAPAVQITTKFLSSSQPAAANQLLKFEVQVANFPAAANQTRNFIVSYGDVHESLAYTLTNLPPKDFAWSVKVPSEWNVSSMKALPIAIHVGDLAPSSVALFQADFSADDKQKHTAGFQYFLLCTNAGPEECKPLTELIAARSSLTLYVRPKAELPVGTLKGNFSILASDKADPDVLPVTIYSPRPNGLWWGVAFLAIGVLLSASVQFLVRPFIRQREQKQVVLLLRERLKGLTTEFGQLAGNLRKGAAAWSVRVTQLAHDLSDKQMKDLMPGLIPQAFESEVTRLETFKTKMEELGNSFAHLRVLLRDGLEHVAEMQKDHPGHELDMQSAAEDIAALPPSADLETRIVDVLKDLRSKAKVPPSVTLAAAKPASPESEIHSVNFQLAAANLVAWFFWGSISVLGGTLLLVLQSPAFGTDYDLAVCIAWGLGITVVGSQAGQLTPTTVAGSLGIKLPGGK